MGAKVFTVQLGPVTLHAGIATVGALLLALAIFATCAGARWRAVRAEDPSVHYGADGE
jgi:hypothetical protein